jgi:hypothetical protein
LTSKGNCKQYSTALKKVTSMVLWIKEIIIDCCMCSQGTEGNGS